MVDNGNNVNNNGANAAYGFSPTSINADRKVGLIIIEPKSKEIDTFINKYMEGTNAPGLNSEYILGRDLFWQGIVVGGNNYRNIAEWIKNRATKNQGTRPSASRTAGRKVKNVSIETLDNRTKQAAKIGSTDTAEVVAKETADEVLAKMNYSTVVSGNGVEVVEQGAKTVTIDVVEDSIETGLKETTDEAIKTASKEGGDSIFSALSKRLGGKVGNSLIIGGFAAYDVYKYANSQEQAKRYIDITKGVSASTGNENPNTMFATLLIDDSQIDLATALKFENRNGNLSVVHGEIIAKDSGDCSVEELKAKARDATNTEPFARGEDAYQVLKDQVIIALVDENPRVIRDTLDYVQHIYDTAPEASEQKQLAGNALKDLIETIDGREGVSTYSEEKKKELLETLKKYQEFSRDVNVAEGDVEEDDTYSNNNSIGVQIITEDEASSSAEESQPKESQNKTPSLNLDVYNSIKKYPKSKLIQQFSQEEGFNQPKVSFIPIRLANYLKKEKPEVLEQLAQGKAVGTNVLNGITGAKETQVTGLDDALRQKVIKTILEEVVNIGSEK